MLFKFKKRNFTRKEKTKVIIKDAGGEMRLEVILEVLVKNGVTTTNGVLQQAKQR